MHRVGRGVVLQHEDGAGEQHEHQHHRREPAGDQRGHRRAPQQIAQAVTGQVGDQCQHHHRHSRDHRHPPLREQIGQPARRHRAKFGGRGRRAEPEEGQRGQRQHQVAQVQAGGDQGRSDRARKQVPQRYSWQADSGQPGSIHVRTDGQCADLAAHDPRIERPPHHRHGDQRVPQRRSERGDHGNGQHWPRQREEGVGNAHQQPVHPAAEGACRQPHQPADHDTERDHGQRGEPGRPCPEQHPAEDVAPHLVGAEPGLCARRGERHPGRDGDRVRSQHRGRQHDEGQHYAETDRDPVRHSHVRTGRPGAAAPGGHGWRGTHRADRFYDGHRVRPPGRSGGWAGG